MSINLGTITESGIFAEELYLRTLPVIWEEAVIVKFYNLNKILFVIGDEAQPTDREFWLRRNPDGSTSRYDRIVGQLLPLSAQNDLSDAPVVTGWKLRETVPPIG